MLTRIISAVVGVPILLFFIIQGGLPFTFMVLVLASIGLFEYSRMIKKKGHQFLFFPMLMGVWVMLVASYYTFSIWASLGIMVAFLSVFLVAVFHFPSFDVPDISANLLGLIYVGWTMAHLILLSKLEDGIIILLYLFVAIWSSDSGAYFVGRFLGKHKLCPSVSPKKTVEGSIGGIVTACIILFLFNLYFLLVPYYAVILIGIVISVVGQLGDLMESLIKRYCDIKDSGNLIPGHGGILDRFDSIMLAAPFMYYCLNVVIYLGQ